MRVNLKPFKKHIGESVIQDSVLSRLTGKAVGDSPIRFRWALQSAYAQTILPVFADTTSRLQQIRSTSGAPSFG
ncbi:hypothetical protein [Thermoactinomyces mirandus]|uniref:hypothetical protein n=1 Tax=Thermoactinomyces mirandus TaxID=2756294 RepID=UPI0015EE8325|nr:hypothetical protein [Thermoactinomyces mirandus]